MKYVKMLGLAAMAAMAAMALAGASTASATDILCETNTTPCTSPVAEGGTITAQATHPLLTGAVELTCASSTMTIEITSNDGTTDPMGKVTGLTWSGCKDLTHFGIGCTLTTQNLPYNAEVVTPGPSLTVEPGSGEGNPGATVVCGGLVSCTFERSDVTLPIDVGSPASVTANAVELEKTAGGGSCPEASIWDAEYIAESPISSLFVSNVTLPIWNKKQRYLVGSKVEHPAGSKKCWESFVITEGETPPGNSWSAITCP